jgi:hypothetical protein
LVRLAIETPIKFDQVCPENSGEDEQTAGTNPVCAILVFLNLLKADPKYLRNILLGKTREHPTSTYLRSNMGIDVPGFKVFWHLTPRFGDTHEDG